MSFNVIHLMLGSACDRHCPYCLQYTGENIPANRKADVPVFVNRFSAWLARRPVNRIAFWGGEPMLYFGKIKDTIEGFERQGVTPKLGYVITTHGRRLTDEYIDFANAHDIWTVVSAHDWDFTDEQYRRIFRLKRFSLSDIIHGQNLDLFKYRERFYALKEKYGLAPKLPLHFIRATDTCSPEFFLTKEKVDLLCRHLLQEILPLAIKGDEWAVLQCRFFLYARYKETVKGFSGSGNGSKCVRDNILAVDYFGNHYRCHHNFSNGNIDGNIFGNINPTATPVSPKDFGTKDYGGNRVIPIKSLSETEAAPNALFSDPHRFSQSEECRNCEIFSECHGNCYVSRTHDVDCYLAKRMHAVCNALALFIKPDDAQIPAIPSPVNFSMKVAR